jgi:hypothetical protein
MRTAHYLKLVTGRPNKPKRFTFPHVSLVNYGPLWELADTNCDPDMRRNPDAMANVVATAVPIWNDLSADGMHDLKFSFDMRHLHVQELSPAAVSSAAVTKDGVAHVVQHLWRWLTAKETPEASERAARRKEASSARRYLHGAYKNKFSRFGREAEQANLTRNRIFQTDVQRWNARIDDDIRKTPDCRDIAVGWPIAFHQHYGFAVPIPVQNPHQRKGKFGAVKDDGDPDVGSHRRLGAHKSLEHEIPKPMTALDRIMAEEPELTADTPPSQRIGITSEGLDLQGFNVDSSVEGGIPSDSEFAEVIQSPSIARGGNVVAFVRKNQITPKHHEPVISKAPVKD